MARTLVPLTKDVWETLGTGLMVITIHQAGKGSLRLNQAQDDDSSLMVTNKTWGKQYSNTTPADTIEAKPSGADWILAVDI